jgi:hypothetical protein
LIIHLKGGLGNQLFQLAFAHDIFEKTGMRQFIYLPRVYRTDHDARRILDNCIHLRALPAFINSLLDFVLRIGLLAQLLARMGIVKYEHNLEVNWLDLEFSKPSRLSWLHLYSGYWQDWKIAASSNELFSKELQLFLEDHIDLPPGTKSSSRIVIHIRRGDLLYQHNLELYGVVPLSSYRKVLNELRILFPSSQLVTLTDSPFEVMSEGSCDDFGVILGPDTCDPWQALKVMKNATAVISANSTLSWWGAFLAVQIGGIVYVPTPWYANFPTEASEKKMFPGFRQYDANYQKEVKR